MQNEHLKLLAECAGRVFSEMTDTLVMEALCKRDQRSLDRFALAWAVPYNLKSKGIKGQIFLGFQEETNAALVASAIAENRDIPHLDNDDATATDLLNQYLGKVMERSLAAWKEAGFAADFGNPATGLDFSLSTKDEMQARAYVVILNLTVGWVVLNFTIKEEAPRLTGKKILVVDSSKVIRSLLTKALSGVGCQVIQASNCREATQMFNKHLPDLTLLDLVSLKGEGVEPVIEKIKLNGGAKLIVLFAGGKDQKPAWLSTVGEVVYLEKPVRMEQLLEEVKGSLAY